MDAQVEGGNGDEQYIELFYITWVFIFFFLLAIEDAALFHWLGGERWFFYSGTWLFTWTDLSLKLVGAVGALSMTKTWTQALLYLDSFIYPAIPVFMYIFPYVDCHIIFHLAYMSRVPSIRLWESKDLGLWRLSRSCWWDCWSTEQSFMMRTKTIGWTASSTF